jgi:hypothetical protein
MGVLDDIRDVLRDAGAREFVGNLSKVGVQKGLQRLGV